MTVTVSSGAMRMNALGANVAGATDSSLSDGLADTPAWANSGRYKLTSNPPPTAAPVFRKSRLFIAALISHYLLALLSQRRDEWPDEFAGRCRSGKYCQS